MDLDAAIEQCSRSPDNLSADAQARWREALGVVYAALQTLADRMGNVPWELREDAASEVALGLTRRAAPPEIKSSAEGWLRKTLVHKISDLQQRSRSATHDSLDAPLGDDAPGGGRHERLADAGPTPEEQLLDAELGAALEVLRLDVPTSMLSGQTPETLRELALARDLFMDQLVPCTASVLRSDGARNLNTSVLELLNLQRERTTLDALIGPQPDEAARRTAANALHKNHQRARARLRFTAETLEARLKGEDLPDPTKFGYKGKDQAMEVDRAAKACGALLAATPDLTPRVAYWLLRYIDAALRQRKPGGAS